MDYKEIHETFYTGKTPTATEEHHRGKGTSDLIVSTLWFVMASASGLFGNFIFTLIGIGGGIYFLVRGLARRKESQTHTREEN